MCLAQECRDAGEAQIRNPSVSSQALYNQATALPNFRILNYLMLNHINKIVSQFTCKCLPTLAAKTNSDGKIYLEIIRL